MSWRKAMRLASLFALAGLATCGAGAGRDDGFVVRDSAGVRIAENSSPRWSGEASWRLAPEPSVRIGVADGPEEYELYRVTGALLLPDGSILLANGGSFQLRLYDPHGVFVWGAGRAGDGPGEFRSLSSLHPLGGDSVGAFDSQLVRLTVFSRDGRLGRVLTPPRATGSGNHFPVGLTPDGSLIVRLGWSSANDPPDLRTGRRRLQDTFIRYGLEGASVDTAGTFLGGEQMTIVTGRGRSFSSPPFPWGRVQAMRGAELLLAYTERFEVFVHRESGELLQILQASIEPEPVTKSERDEFLQEARDQLRHSPPPNPMVRELSELRLAALTFPPTHPVLDRLLVDRTGHVWVRHARRGGARGSSGWSVFEPGGRWLGRVPLPERLRPTDIGADYLLGIATDELEVEYVYLYELIKP